MRAQLTACIAGVLFVVGAVGCEPRPAVEEPGAAESNVEVDTMEETDTTVTEPGVDDDANTGVDVGVGGEEGVNVNVNEPAGEASPGGATENP